MSSKIKFTIIYEDNGERKPYETSLERGRLLHMLIEDGKHTLVDEKGRSFKAYIYESDKPKLNPHWFPVKEETINVEALSTFN